MNLNYRKLAPEEQKYLYQQSSQIAGQTGCVGHLYAKADPDNDSFHTLWEDEKRYLRTPEFLDDYSEAMSALKAGEYGPLKSKDALKRFCAAHPSWRTESGEYALRTDTFRYSYLIRMDPKDGQEGFTLTVYRKDPLDRHIINARKGIRFTDLQYRDRFRLQDGGKIRITYPGGAQAVRMCRYVDEYHLEIGNSIYHICEFADKMEREQCRVEPAGREQRIGTKERAYAGSGR